MNEFNVLLATATNDTPSGSLFDALFARYIAPQESWRELESPLPITFTANGQPLLDYRIYGNTEQSGTPTPENPIMPTGCGERTVNLFDGEMESGYYDNNGEKQSSNNWIRCKNLISADSNTIYHVIIDAPAGTSGSVVFARCYDARGEYIGTVNQTVIQYYKEYMFTTLNDTKFISFYISVGYIDAKIALYQTTIAGKAYEPYGYKLPMTSAGQGVDIYLGEAQSTRRIKKLVLTGGEYWSKNTGIINSNAYSVIVSNYYERRYVGLCSHYATVDNILVEEGIYFGQGINFLTALSDEIDTLDKWKSYLAQQYAAGTPVTVWYVLAEPETAVVNEPLMKIGDYADTVSMEQAGVSIPTAAGETIIDYNPSETPAVEPEKMYIKCKPLHTNATIYGFRINPDEPNSSACVTYLADAVGMTPAAMGSTTFNYGSWADAFFMPKPCMLKFDGTVDYYLDPNDYSKKADGVTPSDYNNLAYNGNAMMEFPLIWYKYVPGVAEGEGYFYVSNHKVNDTYKCWSNMDCDGNIIEHFYMPIYNGCTYDGKMRSISGLTLAPWSTTAYSASATYAVGAKVNYDGKMWKCTTAVETAETFDPEKWEQFAFNGQTTATEEIAQATACNTTAKTEWYIDTWNDRVLINGLLVLISKSIDTQGAFGRGIDSGSQTAKESYVTGSLDDKGLFYGSTANGTTAVKVFGMENWWGLEWHRTAGLIGGTNNTYLYKMTASTADGSIADGYNTTGTGYPSVGGKPTTSNYVKKMQFGLFGFLSIEVGAYSTQYYKDYYYNGAGFALVGGNSAAGAADGAFFVNLSVGASNRGWSIAAAPSCKPCKTLTANHSKEMIQ